MMKGAQSDPNYVSRLLAHSESLPGGGKNYSYATAMNYLIISLTLSSGKHTSFGLASVCILRVFCFSMVVVFCLV